MQGLTTVLALCMVGGAFCQTDWMDSDVCEQPKDKGPCSIWKPRWYFNRHSCECEFFWYGGCDGNDNRFFTKERCEWKCDADRLKFCNGRGNGFDTPPSNGYEYGNGYANGYGNGLWRALFS